MRKNQLPILIVNFVFIFIFSIIFLKKQNHEFLFYIGVILTFLILIIKTNKIIKYPNRLLWGLTFWSIMHMLGGGIETNKTTRGFMKRFLLT
ncbi:MAG: hypothetical protein GF335_01070 [Candidatus Moranbacteria bacterium]|nr:hypothetical protein [Candidatus Moranbacteria bacterium]